MTEYKYKIEDEIPIPSVIGRSSLTATANALNIGQSFVVPVSSPSNHTAGMLTRNLRPKRFAGRLVEENGVIVRRIWRTA